MPSKQVAFSAIQPGKKGWLKGLEPSTLGTTIRCSNQLSYSHRVLHPASRGWDKNLLVGFKSQSWLLVEYISSGKNQSCYQAKA